MTRHAWRCHVSMIGCHGSMMGCHASVTGCCVGTVGCHLSLLTCVMGHHASRKCDAPSCSPSHSRSGSHCGSPFSHSPSDSLLGSRSHDCRSQSCDSHKSWGSYSGSSRSCSRSPLDRSHSSHKDHSWGCSQVSLLTSGALVTEATHPGPQSHPLEVRESDCRALLPLHKTVSACYCFAPETLHRAPEVELNTPYSCPVTWKFASQYEQGQEGSFLHKSWTQPHGFREVSFFQDEAAVKCTFKSPLTLQPKLVSALNWDVCSGVAASLYSTHFLEGAAFKASQALSLLTSLLCCVKLMSRGDLEAQLWLALSSVEDTRSFLDHSRIAQSDTLGALTAIGMMSTSHWHPRTGFSPTWAIPCFMAPCHLMLFRFHVWITHTFLAGDDYRFLSGHHSQVDSPGG